MNTKSLIILITVLLYVSSCQNKDIDPNYFYYLGDKKTPIEWDLGNQFILMENMHSEEEVRKYLNTDRPCRISEIRHVVPVDIYTDSVLVVRNTYECLVKSTCYTNFASDEGIHFVGPYVWTQSNGETWHLGVSNRFIVKLKDVQDFPLLDSLTTLTNTRINYSIRFSIPGTYCIACSRESDGNPIELANYFYETGIFEYAEPDFFGGVKELNK